jgi:hypothetical protein
MQPLDNDMDDLFREAAENYPLRVSGADWDKIAGALSTQLILQPPEAKSNKKKYLWLLLLLLVPLMCNIYNKFSGSSNEKIAARLLSNPEKKTEDQKKGNASLNPNSIATSPAPASDNTNTLQSNTPSDTYDPATFSSDLSAYVNKNITGEKSKAAIQIISLQDEEENNTADIEVPVNDPSLISNELPVEEINAKTTKAPGNVIDQQKKEPSLEKNAKKEKQSKPAEKKLYFNLLAGPDASKVKGRAAGKMGGSVGLTLGFNINKHFAVEAGALYSTKHYSAEYTYFDNSKTQWPSNRIIKIVDGTCRMVEIPITVRYNFNATAKSKFFAAAALSSYLMKKEDYDYKYTFAASSTQHEMYKSYKKSGNNMLSVLQLSAGWQRNIGRFGAVRVQPYYNVPLTGVGIGKLPLSGAGILAGISIPIK